jgi:hypothetical protein
MFADDAPDSVECFGIIRTVARPRCSVWGCVEPEYGDSLLNDYQANFGFLIRRLPEEKLKEPWLLSRKV